MAQRVLEILQERVPHAIRETATYVGDDMALVERSHLIEVLTLLRDDPRRVLLGEDVRDGGMLGLSRAAMQDPALGLRVLATPLTPTANLAHATGLALAGRRPIVLLGSASALLEGYAGLRELGRVGATANGERAAQRGQVEHRVHGFAQGIGHHHQFIQTRTAAIAGVRARIASGGPVEEDAVGARRPLDRAEIARALERDLGVLAHGKLIHQAESDDGIDLVRFEGCLEGVYIRNARYGGRSD